MLETSRIPSVVWGILTPEIKPLWTRLVHQQLTLSECYSFKFMESTVASSLSTGK